LEYFFIQMQLPESASLERTADAARDLEAILKETPGVKYYNTVTGFSLLSTVKTSHNAFSSWAWTRGTSGRRLRSNSR
jgi:HAE1 family hydrophobic/amphiphilic exporter-1